MGAVGIVGSGSGDRPTNQAVAFGRTLVDVTPDVVVADVVNDEVVLEEPDHFQWFVDLFVAEYAVEARSAARAVSDSAERSG